MDNFSAGDAQSVNGTVGIVGLPELADALTRAGLRVITGPDFRKAAISIHDEMSSTGKSFPVLLSDEKAPTKRAWANRISGDTSVFLIEANTGDPILCESASSVATPLPAAALLKTIGLNEFAASVDGLVIEADGTVSGTNGGRSDSGFAFGSDIDAELEALLSGDDEDDEFDISSEVDLTVEEDADDTKEELLNDLMSDDEDDDADSFENNANSFQEDTVMVRRSESPTHLPSMSEYNPFSRDDDPWGDDDDEQTVEPTPAVTRPVVRERPSFSEVPQRPTRPVQVQAPAPVREEQAVAPRRERPVAESFDSELTPRREVHMNANEVKPRVSRRERRVEPETTNPFEAPTVADTDDDLFIPAAILTGMTQTPALPMRRTQPVPEPEVQSHLIDDDFDVDFEEDTNDGFEEPVTFEPEEPYVPVSVASSTEFVPLVGTTPMLFCWGSKGGVGKTTVAMAAAQRAAAAGLKVVLIDANRGQGDIRTYLGLSKKEMSSILDVALGHAIKDSLHGPKVLSALRNEQRKKTGTQLNNIRFGLVLAPKSRTADPSLVTGAVYNRVINATRPQVDLIIIDTQTIEVFDTSGLVESTILPGLASGGWSLAITDLNVTGTANLRDQLEFFTSKGMAKDRTFTLINRATDVDSVNCTNVGKMLSRFSTYLGAVGVDEKVSDSMNVGQVPELNEEATALIDTALYRITSNPEFDTSSTHEAPKSTRRGFRKASK